MENEKEIIKSEIGRKNLKLITIVFEIILYVIMFFAIVQIANGNLKPLLCLFFGSALYFWSTWSLLGDRD